jgi:hypothetical protein
MEPSIGAESLTRTKFSMGAEFWMKADTSIRIKS